MTRGEEPKKKPAFGLVSEESPPKRDIEPYNTGDVVVYNRQLYNVLKCYKSGKEYYLHLQHQDTGTVIEGVSADPKLVRPASGLKISDGQ